MSRWTKFKFVFVVLALVSLVLSESSQTGQCDAGTNVCDSAIDSLSTLESTNVMFLQLGTESYSYRTNETENAFNSFDVGNARQLAAASTPDHHVLERRRIGDAVQEGTATHEDVASYARLYYLEMSRRKVLYLLHISKTAGTFFCTCGITQGCKAIQAENCHVEYDQEFWFPSSQLVARLIISTRPSTCEGLAADYETRGLTLEANENFLLPQGLCHQFWNVIIVRDPLTRLFSFLSMIWESDEERGLTDYDPSIITVEQVFKLVPVLSNNYYIRSLLGSDVYTLPSGAIRRTHLEKAKQRLHTFDVILIQQEQNDSLLTSDINRRIGWSCQGDETEKQPTNSLANSFGGGTTNYRETLRARWSDAEWEQLVARNMLDTELQQYAIMLERLDRHVFDHGAFVNTLSSRPKAGCGFLSS